MATGITRLTIRLPKRDVEFAKGYAKAHGISMAELVDRYVFRIRALGNNAPALESDAISGLIPSDVEAKSEYRQHIRGKHEC